MIGRLPATAARSAPVSQDPFYVAIRRINEIYKLPSNDSPTVLPVDRIEQQYGFTAPKDKGLDTVESCRGVID